MGTKGMSVARSSSGVAHKAANAAMNAASNAERAFAMPNIPADPYMPFIPVKPTAQDWPSNTQT